MSIDQAAIESEILAGLPNERARLDEARQNADFYAGRFDAYRYRPPSDYYDAPQFQRSSRIMERVVKVLTGNLYQAGPTRTLPDHPQAQEWLDAVYRANAADAKWQSADRLATVGQVAAFEVSGNIGPASAERPVQLQLWGAEQLCVWLDPDDPLEVGAVATLDTYDQRRRLRLWTAAERITFETRKLQPNQTTGGTEFRRIAVDTNPYGVLPFAFAHFEFPTVDFWSGGPGAALREVNDYVNFRLTEVGDNLRYYGRPLGTAEGVAADWQPPRPLRPGTFVRVPAAGINAEDIPRLGYLQADLGIVEAEWHDLNHFLDHTLEMHGVPPATIRMVQTDARSGISIVAEQLPLILWAKGRQRPFGHYELDLARLVLQVGAQHLANNGVPRAELEAAAEDPGLVLRWPEMFPDLPGPDRDAADQWLLDNHLTSRTQILMRRESLTREEAEARLEDVAEDLQREQALFAALAPAALQPDAAPAAPGADLAAADDSTNPEALKDDNDDAGE